MRKNFNSEHIEGRLYQHSIELKEVKNQNSPNFGKQFLQGSVEVMSANIESVLTANSQIVDSICLLSAASDEVSAEAAWVPGRSVECWVLRPKGGEALCIQGSHHGSCGAGRGEPSDVLKYVKQITNGYSRSQ